MSEEKHTDLSTIEAIEQRHAVKHYDEAFRMPREDIHRLASLAALAPTAFNIQHYRLVAVTNPKLKAEIRKAAFDQPQVTECSVLFVVAADMKAWEKNPARYWDRTAPEIQQGVVASIQRSYNGREAAARDEALVSASLAAENLMLAAKAMGYDTCPMGGMDRTAVAALVNLPEDHLIAMLVSVGKAKGPIHERPGQLPLDEVLIDNRF